ILRRQFDAFARISLLPLLERHEVDVRLCGSIASHFRSHIAEALSAVAPDARITAVVANPIDCIRP
ncbi:MAG: hypothetical protein K2H98_09780, partial [Duncaniella sp.]|nr:hypothetical protein [Duncaniella sp.]